MEKEEMVLVYDNIYMLCIWREYGYICIVWIIIILLLWRWLCSYSWTNISNCRRRRYILWWHTIIIWCYYYRRMCFMCWLCWYTPRLGFDSLSQPLYSTITSYTTSQCNECNARLPICLTQSQIVNSRYFRLAI